MGLQLEKHKGFTLVELSIVLVTVGLLIGGILAAQSMINTAKIQALVRQVGQFDAAVENFQTKYQQLPGDTSLLFIGTCQGNSDGVIASNAGGGPNIYFNGELAKFWSDLSAGVTLNNSNGLPYLGNSNGCSNELPDNTFVPSAALNPKSTIFAIGSTDTNTNYYLITEYSSLNSVFVLDRPFRPVDVLAVDTKMDDGLASHGNIMAWDRDQTYAPANAIDLSTLGNNYCTVQAGQDVYNATHSGTSCSIKIRMGTSTGNLK